MRDLVWGGGVTPDLLKKPSPADPALIEHECRKRERVEIEHLKELERG